MEVDMVESGWLGELFAVVAFWELKGEWSDLQWSQFVWYNSVTSVGI